LKFPHTKMSQPTTYVNMPLANIFEQVGVPLSVRVLEIFLQFFQALLDCQIYQ
jgi:hypothetical protein